MVPFAFTLTVPFVGVIATPENETFVVSGLPRMSFCNTLILINLSTEVNALSSLACN